MLNMKIMNELIELLQEYVVLGSGNVDVPADLVTRAFLTLSEARKEQPNA